jgi:hypothetical protein
MNLKISYDSLADVCVYQDVISRSHGMCFECAGSVHRQALATVVLLAVGTCKKITCALSTALIANQMPTHIEIY